MRLAQASVLAVLVLAVLSAAAAATFACVERFAAPGEEVCVLVDKTCSHEIQEDDTTRALDQKCRVIAQSMDAVGSWSRTGNHILDNGRLRTSESGPDACALLMTDDLVQSAVGGASSYDCSIKNSRLYSDAFADTVDTIEANGPFCNVHFSGTAKESDLSSYANFLRDKSNAIKASYSF